MAILKGYSDRIVKVEHEIENTVQVLTRYDEVISLKAPKFAIIGLRHEFDLKLADFQNTANEAKK